MSNTTGSVGIAPVIIVDIATITRTKWKRYRKKGIGGSDASILFNANSFKCRYDLYQNKTGDNVEDDLKTLPIMVGNALEPVVAEYFAQKTGFEVYKDTNMYAHPKYPWMIADLDYRIRFPDENTGKVREALLEIKTASFFRKDEWGESSLPLEYEIQARHYMAVMNIDVIFVVCLYDNNEDGMAFVRLDRDPAVENLIIHKEMAFWKGHVEKRVPPEDDRADLVLRSLAKHLKYGDKTPTAITDNGLSSIASRICAIKAQAAKLRSEAARLDDEAKSLYVDLVKAAGGNAKVQFGSYVFTVSRRNDRSCDYDALKLAYPKIYEQFVRDSTSERYYIKQLSAA